MDNSKEKLEDKKLMRKLKKRKGIYFWDKKKQRVIITDKWMHDAFQDMKI